jgi:thioesterase domain-containing protein
MAVKETFIAQSEAVERVLERFRSKISAEDQKHLVCAAHNLAQLDAMRSMVMAQANNLDQEPVASDQLSEALTRLLHLPISE